MALTALAQAFIAAIVAGFAAIMLHVIRQRLAFRSPALAGALAVTVSLSLSQVLTWYVTILPTPSLPVALLAGFLGMLSIQKKPWGVTGLCRSFAMVSVLVTVWAVSTRHVLHVSVSLLVTVTLLYIALRASHAESCRGCADNG